MYAARLSKSVFMCAASCSVSGVAHAQSQKPDETTSSPQVEQIVVTAQRREENLQKIPVAVTVLSQKTIQAAAATVTSDLPIMAPAVTFNGNVGGARIYIRGIGGTGATGDESANSVYMDGVYMPFMPSLVSSFNNIERVEVLKGPQGTLFGRNASGGAINYITKEPSLTPSAELSLGYENYDTSTGSFYGTTGVTDNLAVDVSLFGRYQASGWGTDLATHEPDYRGWFGGERFSSLWRPTDKTELRVTAMFSQNSDPMFNGGQVVPGEIVPAKGGSAAGGQGYTSFYDTTNRYTSAFFFYQANLSYHFSEDLDWATFVNIGSYDDSWGHQLLTTNSADTSASAPQHVAQGAHSWTEELQLLSPDRSPITWIGGLFFYHRSQDVGVEVANTTSLVAKNGVDSWAAYGQTAIPLPLESKLTLGARYSYDLNAGIGIFPAPSEQSHADSKVTYRAVLDHTFVEGVLGYVSYATGFKSGFYNITAVTQPPVRPQTVDTAEVGLKSEFFDHRARLNIAYYNNNFENIQVRAVTIGTSLLSFVNAGAGKSQGIDVDFDFAPTENLTLHGGFTTIDSKYTNFNGLPFFEVNSKGLLVALPFSSAAGRQMINAPRLASTLAADYQFGLGPLNATMSVSWNHNSGYFFDAQNRDRENPYDVLTASLLLAMPKNGWEVRLYGRNLTASQYYDFVNVQSGVGDIYYPAPPRTFGVQVTKRFP